MEHHATYDSCCLGVWITTVLTCLDQKRTVMVVDKRCTLALFRVIWANVLSSLMDRFLTLCRSENPERCHYHLKIQRETLKRAENRKLCDSPGKVRMLIRFLLLVYLHNCWELAYYQVRRRRARTYLLLLHCRRNWRPWAIKSLGSHI